MSAEAGARGHRRGREQRRAPFEPSTTNSPNRDMSRSGHTINRCRRRPPLVSSSFTASTCDECHRKCTNNKRPLLRTAAPLVIVTILLISLTIPMPSQCHRDTSAGDQEELGANADNEHMLSTRLPRQQFRLGLGPTTRAAIGSTFKLVQIHRTRPQATGGGGEEQPPGRKSSLPRGSGKKISSATLKKLLSQTLPKSNLTVASSGGSAPVSKTPASASGASNFKFVFIQRANSTSGGGGGKKHINNQAGSTKGRPPHSPKDSLAASVSRQLASSLLYSAATSLINAGSSSPSLSALASVGQSSPSPSSNDQSFVSSSAAATANEDTSEAGNQIDKQADLAANNDIKRLSGGGGNADARPRKPAGTKTRKSRPSKIYNLPVKFVANGQPSGQVMFHSIKQHFATIKRIQAAAQGGVKNKTSEPSGQGKRKKGQANRITGTNSRLIYLPLKYLSNAKPTMLSSVVRGATSGTKAAHKTSRHSDRF